MSSHHIVREKQEPALYIHYLGAFDEEYLGQLLEWSPTLMVNAEVYEKVMSMGLKVDVVVNPTESQVFQENTRLISVQRGALEAVLDFLIEAHYPAVNIIDENSSLEALAAYIDQINIVIFTATKKSYSVKTGFKVWKPAGSIFYISEGAAFEVSNLKLEEGEKYRVMNDGFIKFAFAYPYLIISETL